MVKLCHFKPNPWHCVPNKEVSVYIFRNSGVFLMCQMSKPRARQSALVGHHTGQSSLNAPNFVIMASEFTSVLKMLVAFDN